MNSRQSIRTGTPSAATTFTTELGSWHLQRFPARKQDPLQAWDAADELIHSWLATQRPQWQAPLLINDSFGALLMACHSELLTPPPVVHSLTDSYVSQRGFQHNSKLNQLNLQLPALNLLQPLQSLPPSIDLVLLKIPKSISLLEFQLATLATTLKPGTPIVAAAKSKLFTPSVRQLFERYCDNVSVSLASKKSRTLEAQLKAVADAEPADFIDAWQLPEYGLEMRHHAGVFARNALDIGARFMLQHMPVAGANRVIDLGCGNGILGIVYAQQSPHSQVTWVDESYLAMASCRTNIDLNLPHSEAYQTRVDDCLSQQPSASADLILCNPPFHQEHAVTEHIARQMFRDAKRVLQPNGELWLVANRHLPYYASLKRLFKQVDQHAQNAKFVIWRARG